VSVRGRRCGLAQVVAVTAAFVLPATAAADTILVNTTADSGTGSLRAAISGAADGDTIEITATGTIGLESELPVIDDDVTISGPGADRLTVTRTSAAEFRIFGIPIAQVTISGLTITNGRMSDSGGTGPAAFGAGILGFGADLTLREVVVSGNHVAATGGSESAFAQGGGIAVLGALTLIDSTVTGNSALATQSGPGGSASASARGGGIVYSGDAGSTLRIENSTIADNNATASGTFISVAIGGLDSEGIGLLEGATIAGNSPSAGGTASLLAGIFADGQLGLRNTIVADTAGGPNCLANAGEEQELDSRGHNLSDDASCTLDQPSDRVGVEPGLGPLAFNGGPTPTMALPPGSPALDAGIGTGADQRGEPRPSDDILLANGPGSNGADIGAFELQIDNPDCRGREGTIAAVAGRLTRGSDGPDVIVGSPGPDRIRGGSGRDLICGLGKGDRLDGGGGFDTLVGGARPDLLWGGVGRDLLMGGRGSDRLRGGPGRDRLLGGPGRDRLLGGLGRDVLRGGPGKDRQKQ
jgi:hypothetical protein